MGRDDRARRWERLLAERWDVLVIGGGITGAGVLAEAVRQGYRAALLERRDFAWGTSSRSGKLVHGGLRYLQHGQVRLTLHSVRERERLLRDEPGLVAPLGILLPVYRGAPIPGELLRVGLVLYDLMAMRWAHRAVRRLELGMLAPRLTAAGLRGGLWYRDALTDDARLVLRVIREAEGAGGLALNYACVESLCRSRSGSVQGVAVRDPQAGRTVEVRARAVVNATGIWADGVRAWLGRPQRLRLLRGSHLVLPAWRLPVAQGVNLFHPVDGRPLYVLPWEGVTLVGTTDVDHRGDLAHEPRIAADECDYLLEAVRRHFPSLDLEGRDVLATFSGVRPVVGTGRKDPSKESREHAVWAEDGLVTVTGGKLTTYRVLACDALRALRGTLGPPEHPPAPGRPQRRVPPVPAGMPRALHEEAWLRLLGRYGPDATVLVEQAGPGELSPVPGTRILWAELRWAAARESVEHLDDLLLRRVRLGVQAAGGGTRLLDRIRPLVQPVLGWDDDRWQAEAHRYVELWHSAYGPSPWNPPAR